MPRKPITFANFDIKHKCGHTYNHTLSSNDIQITKLHVRLEHKICPDCVWIKVACEKVDDIVEEFQLELYGTEKQVTWATKLRHKAITSVTNTTTLYERIGKFYQSAVEKLGEERAGNWTRILNKTAIEGYYRLLIELDATYFIAFRDTLPEYVDKLVEDKYNDVKESFVGRK